MILDGFGQVHYVFLHASLDASEVINLYLNATAMVGCWDHP